MAHYVIRVRSPKPADEVFAYLADLRNFPDWDPGTTSAKQADGDGPAVGARYELEASRSTFCYEVERYEPPSKIVARATKSWISSLDTITVETEGAGSLVTYDAELTLTGALKLGDALLQLMFNRIGSKAADGMAGALDGIRLG